MQKKNLFLRLLNAFENCFMKNHSCISCHREIPDETKFMLCDSCSDEIEYLRGKLCDKCGDLIRKDGECINECKKYHYAFDKNISLCYYTESASKIIKNLKYGKKKYLAPNIVDMMLLLADKLEDIDVILYVPSSKNRLKERGFNQAEEIAKLMGEKLNKQVLDILIKSKHTIHQAGGTQKDRLLNLKDSFMIDEKLKNELFSKTVLIIDDVFTTGSTLNECAKVVKKFKPKKVVTLTFAKTKFNITAENWVFV